jgi:hypothetical protein
LAPLHFQLDHAPEDHPYRDHLRQKNEALDHDPITAFTGRRPRGVKLFEIFSSH